jgi:hypothetical protein
MMVPRIDGRLADDAGGAGALGGAAGAAFCWLIIAPPNAVFGAVGAPELSDIVLGGTALPGVVSRWSHDVPFQK